MDTVATKSPACDNEALSTDPVVYCRGLIENNTADLIARFRAGDSIAGLIRSRSDFMDGLLSAAWKHFVGSGRGGVALIAVGGYGRREMHLHSDIDVLALLGPPRVNGNDREREWVERQQRLAVFFNFLWDIGLKPSQSVRTLEQCAELAQRDQTVITALMESRLLRGSAALFEHLRNRIGPEHMWPSSDFFVAKIEEQRSRYARYHDTAYNLEPNVKEGPGGLRDIQMIGWIVKRHYNALGLQDLIVDGWLTKAEYAELTAAQDFLWRVRFALHALTGRSENRLLFEYQKEIAREFGYEDADVNQAVEQFMQRYYRTVMQLERLNEMLLQLFKEVMLDGEENLSILPIDDQFQAVNNYVEALHPDVFRDDPVALMQIFLLLQQNASLQGIRAATVRLIRQHLYLIDDRFRNDPQVCQVFMDILRHPSGITHQLRRMNRYGVLAAYLPAFGRVVGRMQYDLFHVYTVDEHTLFVLRNLRRFAIDKYKRDHPLCNDIFQLIEKPELLYIAGLMHDIAKGRGDDHSVLGETIAEEFCLRHGLADADTQLVKWLVRHHLLMSLTAQRKDISDPEVINEFALQVGDQNTLSHLYLLTVADIRATNPNLWNSWRDTLLRELYMATRWAFRRGLEKPLEQASKIKAAKGRARALLLRLGLSAEVMDRVWGKVSDEYFLRWRPEEIAWQTIAIASCEPSDLPLVLLRPKSRRGSAEIFVFAACQDSLFARSTAILDQLKLTIFDARIITSSDGELLSSYHVLESSGDPIRDQLRQLEICARLRESLMQPGVALIEVQPGQTRRLESFAVQTQVLFHEDPQDRYTILELIATDRPGLLSKVGQAFAAAGVRLYNAKIATIGCRAEDIFYVTDQEGRPLTRDEQKQQLVDAIIEHVGPK